MAKKQQILTASVILDNVDKLIKTMIKLAMSADW